MSWGTVVGTPESGLFQKILAAMILYILQNLAVPDGWAQSGGYLIATSGKHLIGDSYLIAGACKPLEHGGEGEFN